MVIKVSVREKKNCREERETIERDKWKEKGKMEREKERSKYGS